MKLALAIVAITLTGCSTVIPVAQNNPYDFPPTLLEECREPEFINSESKLSDTIKVMIENNTRATECRISKKALNEMIQMRKDIYKKSVKN